jgi:uncharacterized protein YndB with AHSA1/START domain
MQAMVELSFEADVDCQAEALFDLILDLPGQDRWLGTSSSFRGTTEISSDPVIVGTTYREPGPLGVRNGTVTEVERPTRISFHQPMTMRFGLGTIDILLRYLLRAEGERTHLTRAVTVELPWQMRLVRPLVLRAFRVEGERTLNALKAHAASLNPPGGSGAAGGPRRGPE